MKKIKKLLPTSRVKEYGVVRILLTIQFVGLFLASLGCMVANSYYISVERENFCSYSSRQFPDSTDEARVYSFLWNFNHVFPKMEDTADQDLYYLFRYYNYDEVEREVLRQGFFDAFERDQRNFSQYYDFDYSAQKTDNALTLAGLYFQYRVYNNPDVQGFNNQTFDKNNVTYNTINDIRVNYESNRDRQREQILDILYKRSQAQTFAAEEWEDFAYGNETTSYSMDVDQAYAVTLTLYEIYFVIEIFRAVIFLIAIWITSKRFKKVLGWILNIFLINDAFAIVCVIILMWARWSPQGRLCAGDFLDQLSDTYNHKQLYDALWDTEFMRQAYLLERGQYFRGLTVYVWLWLGLQYIISFVMMFVSCYHRIENPKGHKQTGQVQQIKNQSVTVVHTQNQGPYGQPAQFH